VLLPLLVFGLSAPRPALADVIEDWTCCPSAVRHVTDPGGFIYATSGVELFKVDLQGNTIWSHELDQLGGSRSIAEWLVLDPFGNVIVAGGSSATADQFLVQKWDADGNLQWETQTSGAIHAFRVSTDAAGNAYVLGETPSSLPDFVVAKYAPDGTELWLQIFAGGAINNPFALAVSAAGDVAVVGESNIPGNEYDMATVVYAPDGTERWARFHSAVDGGQDAAAGVDFGPDNSVYVAGWSENRPFDLDTTVIKYDFDGNELWLREYSSPTGAYDLGIWLEVDSLGNVVVGGQSDNDIHVLKYDPAGSLIWERRNDGGFGGENLLFHMVVGPDDAVYLSGNNGLDDMLAMKYLTDGTLAWTTSDSPSIFPVYGFAIAPDSEGGTIVSATWGLIRFIEEQAPQIACDEIVRFQSRCRLGSLVQTRIILNNTSHTGESVEFTIDGEAHQTTVDPSGRAQLSLRGYSPGDHTVELTVPAGCFPPAVVSC
jgi:hypothetical protein